MPHLLTGEKYESVSAPSRSSGAEYAKVEPFSASPGNGSPAMADKAASLGATGNNVPAKAVFENKSTANISRIRES